MTTEAGSGEREVAAWLYGARFGAYRAHALAGPPATVACLVTGHQWPALILAFGAALGWIGWALDYDLRWRL